MEQNTAAAVKPKRAKKPSQTSGMSRALVRRETISAYLFLAPALVFTVKRSTETSTIRHPASPAAPSIPSFRIRDRFSTLEGATGTVGSCTIRSTALEKR